MIFMFGAFILDTDLRELRHDTEAVEVEPKVFDLLLFLIKNRQRVVSKDELINAVWGGKIIAEVTLSSGINAARRTVNDTGRDQRLIRTLPRKGFRFVGKVEERVDLAMRNAHMTSAAAEAATPTLAEAPVWRAVSAERKLVSVLLCDLSDLLTGGERGDPESYEALRSSWAVIVEGCASHFGGILGHSNSERLHVYFGHPAVREDDCERAVRAGLRIMEQITGEAFMGPSGIAAPRISVSSGLAVVRKLSNGQDAIIGEVVGLAERNLGSGRSGDVLVCENVRRQIGRIFAMKPCRAQQVGSGTTGQVWNVTGETDNKDRFEALRSESSPFVGRRDELQLLERQWQSVQQSCGCVTLITGDAGIGKSRLCRQLQQRIAVSASDVMRFQCSSLYSNSWLHPVSRHLRTAACIEPADGWERCIEKLALLFGLLVRRHASDLARTATLFSKGVEGATTGLDGTATEIRESIFRLLGIYLRQRAADSPLLVVFEDLHWIDPTSLDFLSRTVEEVGKMPIFLVLTSRPEFKLSWPEHSHFTEIRLNRLSPSDCRTLIENIAPDSRLERRAAEKILRGADGNPLYAEEITKAHFEQERRFNGKPLRGTGTEEATIPWTLQSSLLMRLDALTHGKHIARLGAVIGVEFSHRMISQISELADCDPEPGLSELTSAQIIYRYGLAPDATYRFKHILVRDTTYASILANERETLHANILKLLEQDALSPPELLAQHAARAGKFEESVVFWRSAAIMASKRGAYRDAARHLESAIEIHDDFGGANSEHVLELLGWLAFIWISADGYLSENARAAAARGCALADKLGHSVHRFLPRYAHWTLQLARGPQLAVLDYIENVHKRIELEQERDQSFFGNAFAGYSALTLGQLNLAEKRLEAAERLYDEDTHNRGARRIGHIPGPDLFFRLSLLRAIQGRLDDQAIYMDKSLSTCPDDLDAHAESQLLMKFCLVCSVTRDFDQLERLTGRLLNLYTEFKLNGAQIVGNMYRGMLEINNGQSDGFGRFSGAAARYEMEIMKFETVPRWVAVADLLLRKDMFGQARAAYDKARILMDETQEYLSLAEMQRIAGVLAAHDSENASAEKYLREAIGTARQQGAGLWELRAACDLAALLKRLGRAGEAVEPLSNAVNLLTWSASNSEVQSARKVLASFI